MDNNIFTQKFPSPVGVRPLTPKKNCSIAQITDIVSVPCWGKAINTLRKILY